MERGQPRKAYISVISAIEPCTYHIACVRNRYCLMFATHRNLMPWMTRGFNKILPLPTGQFSHSLFGKITWRLHFCRKIIGVCMMQAILQRTFERHIPWFTIPLLMYRDPMDRTTLFQKNVRYVVCANK